MVEERGITNDGDENVFRGVAVVNERDNKELGNSSSSDEEEQPRKYRGRHMVWIKSIASILLLLFSIVLVLALIFSDTGDDHYQTTKLAHEVHPALAFCVLWISLLWLALVEGGQASLVGLPPIDRELYRQSHPTTYQICERGHTGDNLDRYLLGRQFMVLALVFAINQAGSLVELDKEGDSSNILNLPQAMVDIFYTSGLALILITCMIGQLNTQINASHCMLDFINDNGNWFTVQIALFIEATGVLHASYLVQIVAMKIAGKEIKSNEGPRTPLQQVLFWGRVVMSCSLLVWAFVVTIVALFEGKTTTWDAIPSYVSLFLFFLLMSVVGMLEGMQIAFFAVSKLTEEERTGSEANPWAARTCALLFQEGGHNLPGFMVGRQLCVVSCFFFIARVISMDVEEDEGTVLGASDGLQEFFNTGLLGALITTIVASIAWQLVASTFPMAFLSNPFTYLLLRLCLVLDSTGICEGAWVLAAIHKELAGFQVDEEYVGTAQERAAMNRGDKSVVGQLAGGAFPANHDLPVVGTVINVDRWSGNRGNFRKRRAKILKNIRDLCEQINLAETDEEKAVYEAALKKEHAGLREVSREEVCSVRSFMEGTSERSESDGFFFGAGTDAAGSDATNRTGGGRTGRVRNHERALDPDRDVDSDEPAEGSDPGDDEEDDDVEKNMKGLQSESKSGEQTARTDDDGSD